MGIQDIKGMHNKKKSAAGANVAHRKHSELPQIRAIMVNAAFPIWKIQQQEDTEFMAPFMKMHRRR
jgi:hypothetical protein